MRLALKDEMVSVGFYIVVEADKVLCDDDQPRLLLRLPHCRLDDALAPDSTAPPGNSQFSGP